jgi:hypothetical protein
VPDSQIRDCKRRNCERIHQIPEMAAVRAGEGRGGWTIVRDSPAVPTGEQTIDRDPR